MCVCVDVVVVVVVIESVLFVRSCGVSSLFNYVGFIHKCFNQNKLSSVQSQLNVMYF